MLEFLIQILAGCKDWASFYDLIASSDAPFLHSTDGRRPLSLILTLVLVLRQFTCARERPEGAEGVHHERPGTKATYGNCPPIQN